MMRKKPRNCHQIIFRKVLPKHIYIFIESIDQKTNFYDFDNTESRLPLTDLSQHFRMYLV